jgi:hypothetical protein
MRITLPDSRRSGQKAWAAQVLGSDPTYRFKRSFLRGTMGRDEVTYDLVEPREGALYEFFCPDLDERYFAWLRRGKLTRLNAAEAWSYVEDLDERLSPNGSPSGWPTCAGCPRSRRSCRKTAITRSPKLRSSCTPTGARPRNTFVVDRWLRHIRSPEGAMGISPHVEHQRSPRLRRDVHRR